MMVGRVTSPNDPREVDPVMGEPSGAPASMAAVEAGAIAWLLRSPHGQSATGARVASRAGQVSWALYDFARNPYILLVTIYIFAPYFTTSLVSDPVKGQAIWGDVFGYSGLTIAALAPLLGAIADAGGRRKPWIAIFVAIMAVCCWFLWYARVGGTGISIFLVGTLVAITNVAYEFSSVF